MSTMRLTRRGRALVNILAMVAFLTMLGVAGWIETGM